jgi:hypothetical protein
VLEYIILALFINFGFFLTGKEPKGSRTSINKQNYCNNTGRARMKRILQPCPSDLQKKDPKINFKTLPGPLANPDLAGDAPPSPAASLPSIGKVMRASRLRFKEGRREDPMKHVEAEETVAPPKKQALLDFEGHHESRYRRGRCNS